MFSKCVTLASLSLVFSSALAFAQESTVAPDSPAAAATGAPATPSPATPEDKRMFGVLPNYRTVEGSKPFAPLTTKQKFTIATKDTIDGPSYVLAGIFAGLYQLTDQNPSFGQGFKGYAHRYGTSIADQDIGNFMTEAIMPTVFREDPRYFRRGSGSVLGRIAYSASRVAIAKTDKGATTFNFAEFVGNGATAAIGNAYYPDSRGASPTFTRMFTQIGTDAISNVLKEFWPDVKKKLHKKT